MKKISMNRWFVVIGSVLLQICLGAIYAWSLFNQPLIDKFGWSKSDVIFTFSITIATFAFATIFAGKIQDQIGPRWVATTGGILLGTGLILSSRATSLFELYFYYGIIGGMGVGTAYVCPLATCLKWFPEKRGFITGIAVGAFGLGSLLFKSIILFLIDKKGVSDSFLYLGIIYMTLILIGAQLLRLPPNDYDVNISTNNTPYDFSLKQMIKTPQFYLLWIMFFFGTVSGLMVIGLAKDIGIDLVKLTPEAASNAVSMIALFNAAGRITWGILSDKTGRIKAFLYMYILTALAMIVMSTIKMNYVLFFISISIIAFSFGGFLAVFPTVTAEYYGLKYLGGNYGILYQAYGVAAIIGPMITASIGLTRSFKLAAVMSAIGILLTFIVNPPSLKKA